MARRRFFVDAVRSGRAQIAGDEALHLTRVLRVAEGQKFEISDNHSVYLATVESARKDLVSFWILESLPSRPPLVETTICASLIRFERFELMMEKATELGVSCIVPVQTERTEKGLEKAVDKRSDRWLRIVREASEQSRRARLPMVSALQSLSAVLTDGPGWVLEEDPSAKPLLDVLKPPLPKARLLIGPEGGWSDRERASIAKAKWTPVSLGMTILRAETAAIAAMAVLNAWAAQQTEMPASLTATSPSLPRASNPRESS